MEQTLNQRAINTAEWHNPDNWAGVGPFKAYFSKRDSRIFVPMWFPLGPSTLNYGHRFGYFVQTLMLSFVLAVWLWSVLTK